MKQTIAAPGLRVCRWCGLSKPLIKAHIIPQTFYAAVRGDSKHAILVAPNESKFTQTTQSGIWDEGILCADCDNKLGELDNYGFQMFGAPPPDSALVCDRDGVPLAYKLAGATAEQAQRFLLSVLWRASVSTHPFFNRVSLGSHYENKIRAALIDGVPLSAENWEFVVIRYHDNKFEKGITPPWKARYEGITCYNLHFPYFKTVIRVDRQRFRTSYAACCFSQSNGVLAVRMSASGMPEERYILGVSKALQGRGVRIRPIATAGDAAAP